MARKRPLTARKAWRGLLQELSSTPLGALASGFTVLFGILQLVALLGDSGLVSARSGLGGIDPLGWIAGTKLPMRMGVFVVYASMVGWSLGYLAVLLLLKGRGRIPPLGYILAILWGLAQQGSADWLFEAEHVISPGLYGVLAVSGLIAAVWLARISIEISHKVEPPQARDCVNMLGLFILSALACSLLVELPSGGSGI